MEEPSVLDYLKSLINPRGGKNIILPDGQTPSPDVQPPVETVEIEEQREDPRVVEASPWPEGQPGQLPRRYAVPWLVYLALALALIGQSQLEPPAPYPLVGVVFYLFAALALVRAVFKHRSLVPPLPPETSGQFVTGVRTVPFLISLGLMVVAFFAFGKTPFAPDGNRFNALNVVIWVLLIGYFLWAWWQPRTGRPSLAKRVRVFLSSEHWKINVSRWTVLVLAVFLLAAFYRFYRLSQVPGEMFSDQAEKLLDVNDLINGQTKIFFERNTGREFFQFYLTAAVSYLFNTGISFLSLKIGTALAGLFTLPFIYLLGKELGGRRVGLFALFLAGIAYWPNTIARIGLRFPLYPLFAAPALYFLVRGLRRKSRNDLILAGLAVGLGLHGYSPFRIVPFVIAAGVAVYALHWQSLGSRKQAVWGLVVLALAAFVIFLPLFRYALVENPDIVNSRAISRLSSAERELPGSPLVIFFTNTFSALIMPFWKNGDIWVHSVVNRPALDVVSAALFFIGLIVVITRYVRQRNWADLFLLVSIPLLMLPSILSLAFPEENPSLNRTGGAYIPIFIIAAVGLEGILLAIRHNLQPRAGRIAVLALTAFLLFWSCTQNFDLVFRQFDRQFMGGAWNTSDIGRVVRGFADSVGTLDTAYVVPHPYWVDTRLVGINAGYPTKDYALWPKDFETTLPETRTKLFILHPEDTEALAKLRELYPSGVLSKFTARLEGKDFLMYLVPGISEPAP